MHLARGLWERGVAASAVHPGTVFTALAKEVCPRLPDSLSALQGWFAALQDAYMRLVLRSPEQSAAVCLHGLRWGNARGDGLSCRRLAAGRTDRGPTHLKTHLNTLCACVTL